LKLVHEENKGRYRLACFGTLLDICHKFLLALLKLRPFTVQLSLSFSQGTLMLSQPLSRCDRPAK
jgi:hypothetical protein